MSRDTATTTYAVRSIEELPQLWDGFAKLVRTGLGITAFGANILDLPANYTTEPHDEIESGQQEMYVALSGSGHVLIGEHRLTLDDRHLVRVDAPASRTLSSGPGGLRVLCVGSTPGAAYAPPDWSSAAT